MGAGHQSGPARAPLPLHCIGALQGDPPPPAPSRCPPLPPCTPPSMKGACRPGDSLPVTSGSGRRPCCPGSAGRSRSAGRTPRRAHCTGRAGRRGNPSGQAGSGRNGARRRLAGSGTAPWRHHRPHSGPRHRCTGRLEGQGCEWGQRRTRPHPKPAAAGRKGPLGARADRGGGCTSAVTPQLSPNTKATCPGEAAALLFGQGQSIYLLHGFLSGSC